MREAFQDGLHFRDTMLVVVPTVNNLTPARAPRMSRISCPLGGCATTLKRAKRLESFVLDAPARRAVNVCVAKIHSIHAHEKLLQDAPPHRIHWPANQSFSLHALPLPGTTSPGKGNLSYTLCPQQAVAGSIQWSALYSATSTDSWREHSHPAQAGRLFTGKVGREGRSFAGLYQPG